MGKKGGPNVVKIDWAKVDKMARAQSSAASIADALGIHWATLRSHCMTDHKIELSEYIRLKKTEGMENLRVKQYDVAMEGDKTMLIWLGKQYLGQSESQSGSQDTSITIEVNGSKDTSNS